MDDEVDCVFLLFLLSLLMKIEMHYSNIHKLLMRKIVT